MGIIIIRQLISMRHAIEVLSMRSRFIRICQARGDSGRIASFRMQILLATTNFTVRGFLR